MNNEENKDCLDCDPFERAMNEIVREFGGQAGTGLDFNKYPQNLKSQEQGKESKR